jgi:hypothetical protein
MVGPNSAEPCTRRLSALEHNLRSRARKSVAESESEKCRSRTSRICSPTGRHRLAGRFLLPQSYRLRPRRGCTVTLITAGTVAVRYPRIIEAGILRLGRTGERHEQGNPRAWYG